MFSKGSKHFDRPIGEGQAYFAYIDLGWNAEGIGNTSCASGGCGRVSCGYIDPYNSFLNRSTPDTGTILSLMLRNAI
jgi:hypothetical protein